MKLNGAAKVGLIIGGLGALVGLTSAFIFEPITGIIISVVLVFVFLLIYRVIIKPSMEYSRIMKTGRQATAEIISVAETGTRINEQPLVKIELKVNDPQGDSYVTSTKTVISFVQINQFQPGAQVPIMIDPNNRMKVVMIRQGDMPNPMNNASPEQMEELKAKLQEMDKANEEIRENGIYCKAIVTKYTNMGVNVNGDNPLVTMELQVLPETEPAFEATVKCVVKSSSVPLYQPGEEIFVKYDQYDKSKVAVEHS